jgi:caffeoyl-CoA O-methyltransferase
MFIAAAMSRRSEQGLESRWRPDAGRNIDKVESQVTYSHSKMTRESVASGSRSLPLEVLQKIMKARIDAIIQRNQAEYLEGLISQTDPLLREMEEYGARHGVPSADREVALFVEITARAINARRALEIGMAIGYTTIHLARAVEDVGEGGLVVTIDPNDEMIRAAEGYLTRAGLRARVRIERGKALEVIPQLKETFDLLFIDAVKEEYSDYLKLSLPRLRRGGVVIVDNLLWGGQVAGEIRSADQESSTNALREFNKYFVNHPKLRAEILSVGDGLGYAVKV